MWHKDIFHKVANSTLSTFDDRQSFSPGMFEPLKTLFAELGYDHAAVYITDDFPDRMHLTTVMGDTGLFPQFVVDKSGKSLTAALREKMADRDGVMIDRLYNHGRELGALVAICPRSGEPEAQYAFETLAHSMSVMAYIERIRTNSCRERDERDVFFAQSLTNRLMLRDVPQVPHLRLGYEFVRSLEAAGDFFDLMPSKDGLIGYIGCCNGKGLRTVMEVCCIMRQINRVLIRTTDLAEVMETINRYLVVDKKRAHQASLCLFRIDVEKHRLELAKAGRLGIIHFCDKHVSNNISASSAMFLGMMPNPRIFTDSYQFCPGSSLMCVTEDFYNSVGISTPTSSPDWFLRTIEETVQDRPRIPLANAVFKRIAKTMAFAAGPVDSMLALSVEFRRRKTTTSVVRK